MAKLVDFVIPDLPNGLGDVSLIFPLAIIGLSILLEWKQMVFVISIYIFGFVWLNPHMFIPGIEYVTKMKNVVGVYFLDYVIPVLALSSPALFKGNKLKIILISIIIKYTSHVCSGLVFWSDYAWSGWAPITYSIIANLIVCGPLFIIAIPYSILLQRSSKNIIVQNGYVNNSYKIKKDGKYYQKRVPKINVANWSNEKLVYMKLGINIEYNERTGEYTKEWIKGKNVRVWTSRKAQCLRESINEFHNIDKSDIIEHNWLEVSKYKEHISSEVWNEFTKLVQSFDNHKKVLSHNDINKRNVLWKNNKIILIDFEWTRVNSEYFDYAQFEIAEGKRILPKTMDEKIYDNVLRATLIYCYLWTFSMEDSKKIIRLRTKYNKLLNN